MTAFCETGKVVYASLAEAKRAARRIRKRIKGNDFNAYACEHGPKHWHLATIGWRSKR